MLRLLVRRIVPMRGGGSASAGACASTPGTQRHVQRIGELVPGLEGKGHSRRNKQMKRPSCLHKPRPGTEATRPQPKWRRLAASVANSGASTKTISKDRAKLGCR